MSRRLTNDDVDAIARAILDQMELRGWVKNEDEDDQGASIRTSADRTSTEPSGDSSSAPPEVVADIKALIARSSLSRRRARGSANTNVKLQARAARSKTR